MTTWLLPRLDPEGNQPNPSRRTVWTNTEDTRLWGLYRDPNNNNRQYLLEKSQLYFPNHSHNPDTAVRRLCDNISFSKNAPSVQC